MFSVFLDRNAAWMFGKTPPWAGWHQTAVRSTPSYYEWPDAGDADWSYTTSCHEQRYGQFQNVWCKEFHSSCYAAPTCSVLTPSTKSVHTTNRALKASSTRTGLRSLLPLTVFTASWHYNCYSCFANSILHYVFKNQKWRKFSTSQQTCSWKYQWSYRMFLLGQRILHVSYINDDDDDDTIISSLK
jgi:hypothetical protein